SFFDDVSRDEIVRRGPGSKVAATPMPARSFDCVSERFGILAHAAVPRDDGDQRWRLAEPLRGRDVKGPTAKHERRFKGNPRAPAWVYELNTRIGAAIYLTRQNVSSKNRGPRGT